MKIFCGQCANYIPGAPAGWTMSPISSEACKAPENLIDTHFGAGMSMAHPPSEINKDNDCPWFMQRGKVELVERKKRRWWPI